MKRKYIRKGSFNKPHPDDKKCDDCRRHILSCVCPGADEFFGFFPRFLNIDGEMVEITEEWRKESEDFDLSDIFQ